MDSALSRSDKQIDKKMQPGGLEVRQGSRGFKTLLGPLLNSFVLLKTIGALLGYT